MQTIKKGDPNKTIEAKKLQKEKDLERSLEFINGFDKRLEKTFHAIEADSFSEHQIWKNWFYDVPAEKRKFDFVQDHSGRGLEIGKIGDRPIVMSFIWWTINGHPVLFYHCTSQLVDWKMVEDWFIKYMPHLKARVDAQNAHNVLNYLED